eukprot:m.269739 g.269739  ORF g.269739 m.269739 type:complete len:117 (-) comp54750_c1_seq2:8-358(-)
MSRPAAPRQRQVPASMPLAPRRPRPTPPLRRSTNLRVVQGNAMLCFVHAVVVVSAVVLALVVVVLVVFPLSPPAVAFPRAGMGLGWLWCWTRTPARSFVCEDMRACFDALMDVVGE